MKLLKRLVPNSILSKLSRIPVKLLGMLPISSEIIGAPKGFYSSTKNWATVRGDRTSLKTRYLEVYPSQPIPQVEPKTIDSEIHWRYQIGRQNQSPPAFVATVPNGRLWGHNAVITPNDKLLADVSIGFKVDPNNPKHHAIYQQWKLPAQKRLEGTTAVLSVAGGNTFAHWLLDVLPRLELIRQAYSLSEIDQFVFNGVSQPFQRETLALLGIPFQQIVTSSEQFHVKSDRLIVPSLSRQTVELSKWIPRWACEFLRHEFLKPELIQPDSKFKRIYISRASANRRKLLNEPEVLSHLIPLGFQNIILEKLSILEQIQLFASAEVVVAPHGAGLAHLVFSNPGTKLIEFLSPNYININFWVLSNQVNLDYYYLLGEGNRPTAQSYRHVNGDDILVDINKLKDTLSLAGLY